MRCGICASDCKTFTTNLRKHEGTEHEKEMVFHRAGGDSGDIAVHLHRRRDRAAPVELAVAATVRLARAHLLASPGPAGAVPHPLRRIRRTRFPSPSLASSHARALHE